MRKLMNGWAGTRSMAAVLVGALLHAGPALAGSKCPDGFEAILDLEPQSAALALKAYRGFDDHARTGMAAILWTPGAKFGADPENVIETMLTHFPPGVQLDQNALGSVDELFKAVADLTDTTSGSFVMRPGLEKTVADLGKDYGNFAQGATFDLRMAKEIGAANTTQFQRVTPVPDTGNVRITDLVEECPGNCGDLPGVLHENKNFTTQMQVSSSELASPPVAGPYFKYGDDKVNSLASEFCRDILVHRGTGFTTYRLNMRLPGATQAQQAQLLMDLLNQQFDCPLLASVVQVAADRDALRQQFFAIAGQQISFFPF